ncbi:TPA: hypothetical protein ACKOII_000959 [Clostridioides difficile]|uniref:hypothetical protein n=1 Tax=Clostridioides difficile TaxID=1496 RepID=UPI001F19AAC7|nr:hypothetical protein [Clostridioides difficile]MCE4745286.1 hypothetical protein [Clostridioides difficile]MCF8944462.1 hypothetical protein [Clostridioides difficile]
MGIGNIKVIFEVIPATFRVKHRYAFAVLIDPPFKLPVPSFKSGYSGSIGALCENQKLLVKAAFIVSAGRGQKALPRLRTFRNRHACTPIQLCD